MTKRLLCSVIALLLLFAMPVTAFAKEDGTGISLTVYYQHLEEKFDGVKFQVWKAADAGFSMTEDFAGYPAEIKDGMSDSDWVNLAELLAGYVQKDGLKPAYEGVTDKEGAFRTDNLDSGLYLVIGSAHQEKYKENGVTRTVYYQPAPFLVAVMGDEDVSVSVKFSSSEKKSVSRRILKVWDDKGNESARPSSVKFDLVCDGKVAETVELNKANNWSYQWDDLDNTKTWRIVEHVPDGYKVSSRTEGITYVVTNTRVKEADKIPTKTPVKTETSTKQPTRLPQTGQDWTEALLFVALGFILFILGVFHKQESEHRLLRFCLSVAGIIFLAAALILICRNFSESKEAGSQAENAVQQIEAKIRENPTAQLLDGQDETEYVPDYVIDPDRELPEAEIDGNLYVGTISIDSLGLELPVLSQWSYPGLKIAPCRYLGTPYNGLFVVCAHNYKTHFGPIGRLEAGDRVEFTDMDGNEFGYSVAEVITIDPYADIENTEHDLVLFTCTLGGATRVAVYCDRDILE